MSIIEIILLAIALSADALAVSMCKGTAGGTDLGRKILIRNALICGIWFGVFQALMPTVGFFVGGVLKRIPFLENATAWIAFLLLAAIGINMIVETIKNKDECTSTSIAPFVMLPLALATSIDALVSGVSINLGGGQIWLAAPLIGAMTFTLSAIGYIIGRTVAQKIGKAAEIIGGSALIVIGITIIIRSYL